MSIQIAGGCFCGSIRYAFEDGAYATANCHCTMCRRTSAAPFVPWIVVPKEHFRYTDGTPKVLNSSQHGTRYFCADCGTPLACENDSHADVIDITICSLDAPEVIIPEHEVYLDTRLPWSTATE